jgi:hypothetical protein
LLSLWKLARIAEVAAGRNLVVPARGRIAGARIIAPA